MSKSCNHCGNEIKWPEPYYKGALPLNPDGTEHRCKEKPKQDPHYEDEVLKTEPKQTTIPQAKDFDEMQEKTLMDDGYSRAKRKIALLRGVRKALGNESEPVIGMIFNQICADLRL